MKTEVYSWRVSTELKTNLEREARNRKVPLSAVLELAATEWLKKSRSSIEDDEEQRRLHEAASKCFGVIDLGDGHASTRVREIVRERLRRKHGR